MFLVGVDIKVELDKRGPFSIGDKLSGKVVVHTSRQLAFYSLQLSLFWRATISHFRYAEDIEVWRLAGRTDMKAGEKRPWPFEFSFPLERSTFKTSQLEAVYSVEARITPIRSRIEKMKGDRVHLFSSGFMESCRTISVRAPLFTYRVAPRKMQARGVNLFWLGSAGGWLGATLIGGVPALVLAFGALTISTLVYANRLYHLQETPMRIVADSDNGVRVLLYTTSDARVLDGRIFYRVLDIRSDREERKNRDSVPLIQVGGEIRKFGRMTDDGFEVTLPWPTKPLPVPAHIGASHYKWELTVRPSAEVSLIKETYSLNVRLITEESLKRFRGNREA